MSNLFDISLLNAAVACVFAIAVYLLSRLTFVRNRPAFCCGLWLLVLGKLLTPLLIELPVIPPVLFATSLGQPFPAAASPSHSATATRKNPPTAIRPEAATVGYSDQGMNWKVILLCIAAAGTIFFVTTSVLQMRQMVRALRRSESYDPRIAPIVRTLSADFGLKCTPVVAIVDASVPPLLWVRWSGPLILLPRKLVDSFSDQQLRCVISHELAHYVRRDHLATLLTMLTVALFWWHPVSWWARRELLAAQEACCDALVINNTPELRHCYATTLFETIEFLQNYRASLPAIASGFGSNASMRRRFEMIACSRVTCRLSTWNRLILTLGLIALPCLPTLAEDQVVALKKCPKAVQKTLSAEVAGGRLIAIEKEKLDQSTIFEAEVAIENSLFNVRVHEDGRLISKIFDRQLVAGNVYQDDKKGRLGEGEDDDEAAEGDGRGRDEEEKQDDDDDGDDNGNKEVEQNLKLADLPKAVRKTLKREALGAEIEDLEREFEAGRVIYSADLEFATESGELLYELEIAENGTLLRKVLESADDQAEDDAEDDHDDDDRKGDD